MINMYQWRKMMMVTVALLAMSMTLTSCQTLRKKFTRKKKQAVAEDRNFTPVLEPEEYAAPEQNPVENYKQHYALIKTWYTDLWTYLGEKNSEKRAMYTLKQIIGHIDDMEKLVIEPVRVDLKKLRGYLDYYEKSLGEAAPLRNVSRIQSDLRGFHRYLRQKLTPEKVKNSFVPVAK